MPQRNVWFRYNYTKKKQYELMFSPSQEVMTTIISQELTMLPIITASINSIEYDFNNQFELTLFIWKSKRGNNFHSSNLCWETYGCSITTHHNKRLTSIIVIVLAEGFMHTFQITWTLPQSPVAIQGSEWHSP